ncbi:MAG: DUF481 domain-containing protein [Candidatus Margulisiibacteriota bacterium]
MMKRSIWILVLFLGFGFYSSVQAQVFILDLPGYPLNPGFNNQLNFNQNSQGGNTVLNDTQWSFRTDYVSTGNRVVVAWNSEYGVQSGAVYANKGTFGIRNVGSISGLFDLELMLSNQYNYPQQIQNRFMAGGGIRMILLGTQDQAATVNLSLGLGALNENQTFVAGGTKQETRLVNYLAWLWNINSNLTFNSSLQTLVNVTQFSDFRQNAVLKLTCQLTSNLALNSQFDYQYNSQPQSGVLPTDTHFSNGVTWTF